jgi:hypothetical protein
MKIGDWPNVSPAQNQSRGDSASEDECVVPHSARPVRERHIYDHKNWLGVVRRAVSALLLAVGIAVTVVTFTPVTAWYSRWLSGRYTDPGGRPGSGGVGRLVSRARNYRSGHALASRFHFPSPGFTSECSCPRSLWHFTRWLAVLVLHATSPLQLIRAVLLGPTRVGRRVWQFALSLFARCRRFERMHSVFSRLDRLLRRYYSVV